MINYLHPSASFVELNLSNTEWQQLKLNGPIIFSRLQKHSLGLAGSTVPSQLCGQQHHTLKRMCSLTQTALLIGGKNSSGFTTCLVAKRNSTRILLADSKHKLGIAHNPSSCETHILYNTRAHTILHRTTEQRTLLYTIPTEGPLLLPSCRSRKYMKST